MSTGTRLPLGELHAVLDEVLAVDPVYLTTAEKRSASLGLARAEARLQAARLRLLAACADVAEETGDRSAATWLANETREAHGTVRRDSALAAALDARWTHVAEALGRGSVNLAQARVIATSLEALPRDLGADLLAKAEALLVDEAATLGPRELRVFGSRVLEYLAPDAADEVEHGRLLAEERRAQAATRLSMRPRGDGSTDVRARIPDHAANRLRAYLNAYTAPRRRHLDRPTDDEVAQLPIDRQRGEAFVALLENLASAALPSHGGTATTVMVTLDYETLVSGVGVATTSTGESLTAGQARRLACQAGILPVVLGGDSEILDVGRTRRLVTDAIRKALNLRDRGCTAQGCTMPAEFCEAHHILTWARGGKTSLENGKLLCSFHHHRAHDPGWISHHEANGRTAFTRRT